MNKCRNTIKAFALLFFSTLTSTYLIAQEIIHYPQPMQVYNKHHLYPLSLLELAISKIEPKYQLKPSKVFMNQGRALKQLAAEDGIDVLWTMTSEPREQALKPIRIPIYKGLIGWRVFLMNGSPSFDSSRPIPLTQIKQLDIIQGHDWPDTRILKHNQFNVHTGPEYAGLFKMLEYKRADLFPRSIIEVWDELKVNATTNIKLEQHTLISYPTASYYFVANTNVKLAQAIKKGLERSIEDGSFDALFQQHFSGMIAQAKLNQRTHYQLENPLLTEETPRKDKRLWFSPNNVE